MKVLSAGFIGSHVAMRLFERGDEVIGCDNLSDYCDETLTELLPLQAGAVPDKKPTCRS